MPRFDKKTSYFNNLQKNASLLFIATTLSAGAMAEEKQLPPNVSFIGDWSAPTQRPGAGVWRDLQTWNTDRIVAVKDATFSENLYVADIKVLPGDKVGGWSGERAEVSTMQTMQKSNFSVNKSSGHEYYGIAVKLPTDWQPPVATSDDPYPWGIILQLHGPDQLQGPDSGGTSPAFALCAENDFHLNLQTGDVYVGGTRTRPKNAVSVKLSDGDLNKGKWVRFMIDVVWSEANDGYLAVYRKNEGQTGWNKVYESNNTPTLQYAYSYPVKDHYWKSGYYRNRGLNFTSSLRLGPVVRGKTFQDVEKAAFGDN